MVDENKEEAKYFVSEIHLKDRILFWEKKYLQAKTLYETTTKRL